MRPFSALLIIDPLSTMSLSPVEARDSRGFDAPTNDNVITGHYKLTTPLLLIVKGTPDVACQELIDFMLDEGQKIVAEHGYVPVKTIQ